MDFNTITKMSNMEKAKTVEKNNEQVMNLYNTKTHGALTIQDYEDAMYLEEGILFYDAEKMDKEAFGEKYDMIIFNQFKNLAFLKL